MDIGMLWFDKEDKKCLQEKVERAADYYEKKYGRRPNKVLLNPAQTGAVAGFMVESSKLVLPHHMWLGVENEGSHA